MSYVILKHKHGDGYRLVERSDFDKDTWYSDRYVVVQNWSPPVEPRFALVRDVDSQAFKASIKKYKTLENVRDDYKHGWEVIGFLNPKTGELEHE